MRAVVERFSWLRLAAVRDIAAGIRWAVELRWGSMGQPHQRENKAYPSLQANIHGTKAGHKEGEAVRLSGVVSKIRQWHSRAAPFLQWWRMAARRPVSAQ
jgi:hypothetical protein